MSTLNKVQLIGRLGKDPELRYTQNNAAVASFSMATEESYKVQNEWQKKTSWHNIVAWKKTAEFCSNYLEKGKLVYVEGRIETRKYSDKNGNNRHITEIIAIDVKPMEKIGRKEDKQSDDEDLGPAFPSEHHEMDDIPF